MIHLGRIHGILVLLTVSFAVQAEVAVVFGVTDIEKAARVFSTQESSIGIAAYYLETVTNPDIQESVSIFREDMNKNGLNMNLYVKSAPDGKLKMYGYAHGFEFELDENAENFIWHIGVKHYVYQRREVGSRILLMEKAYGILTNGIDCTNTRRSKCSGNSEWKYVRFAVFNGIRSTILDYRSNSEIYIRLRTTIPRKYVDEAFEEVPHQGYEITRHRLPDGGEAMWVNIGFGGHDTKIDEDVSRKFLEDVSAVATIFSIMHRNSGIAFKYDEMSDEEINQLVDEIENSINDRK